MADDINKAIGGSLTPMLLALSGAALLVAAVAGAALILGVIASALGLVGLGIPLAGMQLAPAHHRGGARRRHRRHAARCARPCIARHAGRRRKSCRVRTA